VIATSGWKKKANARIRFDALARRPE